MEEIGLCLFKALYWRTLIRPHIRKCYQHHNHTHTITRFTIFTITEKRIRPQYLHTAKESLNFLSKEKICFQGWVQYGKIQMAVPSTIDVPGNYTYFQFFTNLLCTYWTWCQCTRTRKRGIRWPQCHLEHDYIWVNGNCATDRLKKLWHTYDNTLCNLYHWC